MSFTQTAKDSAAKLRKDLKGKFPGIKFSVKLASSGWLTCLNVSWVDGPSVKEVEALTAPLKDMSFNSIDDSWNKVPGIETDISMVSLDRDISPDARKTIESFLENCFDVWRFTHKEEYRTAIQWIYGSPKSWADLDEDGLAGVVRWVANRSEIVSGLISLMDEAYDF
jgi:hypothetical protein